MCKRLRTAAALPPSGGAARTCGHGGERAASASDGLDRGARAGGWFHSRRSLSGCSNL